MIMLCGKIIHPFSHTYITKKDGIVYRLQICKYKQATTKYEKRIVQLWVSLFLPMQRKKIFCHDKISIKSFNVSQQLVKIVFKKVPLKGQKLKVYKAYNWETKLPSIEQFLHIGTELY